MKVDGFDLIISGAQREDDSEIQCQLQGSDDLIKKVKVTVLGEYTKAIHLVHKGHTLSIHWVLLTTSEIKMIDISKWVRDSAAMRVLLIRSSVTTSICLKRADFFIKNH